MYISSDTNIWIDFQVLGVPRLPLKLSHIFCMSKEALRDELLTPPGLAEQLTDSGLISLELTEEEFFFGISIYDQYPQLSKYDALALAIAKKRNYILLTGDMPLRKVAKRFDVLVRGTLWIMDELLSEHILSVEQYSLLMKKIKEQNGKRIRLPISEVEKRISEIETHISSNSQHGNTCLKILS